MNISLQYEGSPETFDYNNTIVIVDEADQTAINTAVGFDSECGYQGFGQFRLCEKVHMLTATSTNFLRKMVELLPDTEAPFELTFESKAKFSDPSIQENHQIAVEFRETAEELQ